MQNEIPQLEGENEPVEKCGLKTREKCVDVLA